MTERLCLLAAALSILRAAVPSASAQTTTAELTGRIMDSTGAAVPRASIAISNIENGARRATESNDAGVYAAPALQPGNYRVTVKREGFNPVSQSGVTRVVDQVARVDFGLELGSMSESVDVKAQVPLLEQETSSLGQVI